MQLAIEQPPIHFDGILLRLHELNLLVPDIMVEEIFWPALVDNVADAPEWIKGSFRWNDRTVPLLAFEQLNDSDEISTTELDFKEGDAVAIINGSVNRGYLPYYGILLRGDTSIIELNKKSIAPDIGRHSKRAEACWITVDNCLAVIPKIEWIERHLLAHVLRAKI